MSELIETHRTNNGRFEFIVLRGDLGSEVLWNVGGPWVDGWKEFVSEFEIDDEDYLGDPKEDHYQGTTFTRLIRRKSDGAVFGQTVWRNPGMDQIEDQPGDSCVERLGIFVDWDNGEEEPTVFFPVREFFRKGYAVQTLDENLLQWP